MAIVGTCENESPNQLPAWTSNRFAVFLEYDPAGLPTSLMNVWKVAISLSGVNIARLRQQSSGKTQIGAAASDAAKIAVESTATLKGTNATHDSLVSGN